MLHVVRGFDDRCADVLDKAFRFRHAAFVEEAGWENLRREDGREIDQFDTNGTIHVILEKQGQVVAYGRLNPTTEPYVLSEVYPHLAARGIPRDPGTWEWSRMGTARHARSDGRGWGGPIGSLFRCITVVSLRLGIDTLVWQAHPVWITRAGELGFDPVPLGTPHRVAGERIIAVQMAVTDGVLAAMDAAQVPEAPTVIWGGLVSRKRAASARSRELDDHQDSASFLASALGNLKQIANRNGMNLLAYFIAMAEEEARSMADGDERPKPKRQ
jgi:acyl-homoserine lactone synthase